MNSSSTNVVYDKLNDSKEAPDGSSLSNALARASVPSTGAFGAEPDLYSAIQTLLRDPVLLSSNAAFPNKWERSDDSLGSGKTYEVWQRTMEISGIQRAVAVKRLIHTTMPKPGTASTSPSEVQNLRPLLRDLRVMQLMQHCPTVIEFLATDVIVDDNGDYVVPVLAVELATHGTLVEFLTIGDIPPPGTSIGTVMSNAFRSHSYTTRKSLIADVAAGLYALHAASVFHTDIKPDNVLVFDNPDSPSGYRAKLSDFGSALIHDPKRPSPRFALGGQALGTPGYRAPELIGLESEYILKLSDVELQKADVYSFGVLMAESLTSCSMPGGIFNKELCTFLESEAQDCVPADDAPRIKALLERCSANKDSRLEGFIHILNGLRVPIPEPPEELSDIFDTPMNAYVTSFLKVMMETMLEFELIDGDKILRDEMIRSPMHLIGLAQFLLSAASIYLQFVPTTNWWREFLAGFEDGSAPQLMLAAFSYGAERYWDPLQCCEKLLAAAQGGYLPAKTMYRRVNEALFSVPPNNDVDATRASDLPATAIRTVDGGVFDALESLEKESPDNFLASLVGFYLRTFWADAVQRRLAETSSSSTADMAWRSNSSDPEYIASFQSFIRKQHADMAVRRPCWDEAKEEGSAILLAGAILFDDENSALLDFSCETWQELGFTLEVHFDLRIQKEMSPLALACVLGKANSVRTLCKYDHDSSLNRLQSPDGDVPLHYLFVFQDADMEEMFKLLSEGVDLGPRLVADGSGPESHLCFLCGSPLDFAFQVGSDQAVALLWPFFKRSTLIFSEDSLQKLESIYQVDSVVLDALKCFASCSLPIWERYISDLSPDETSRLKALVASPVLNSDGGIVLLYGLIIGLCVNKPNNMLLHGPNYFQNLVLQLSSGLSFLSDTCGAQIHPSWVHVIFMMTADPDIHLALSLSAAKVMDPVVVAESLDFHQSFAAFTVATPQYPWLSRNIGHALPSGYDPFTAMYDIFAATKANNISAVHRVLDQTRADGLSLRDQGIVDFITARFTEQWTPALRDSMMLISQLDRPPTRSRIPLMNHLDQLEEGKIMMDAIRHHNADMKPIQREAIEITFEDLKRSHEELKRFLIENEASDSASPSVAATRSATGSSIKSVMSPATRRIRWAMGRKSTANKILEDIRRSNKFLWTSLQDLELARAADDSHNAQALPAPENNAGSSARTVLSAQRTRLGIRRGHIPPDKNILRHASFLDTTQGSLLEKDSSVRTAMYAGSRVVLVEDYHISKRDERLERRAIQLAMMLSQPRVAGFGVLECEGLVHNVDTNKYEFIFDISGISADLQEDGIPFSPIRDLLSSFHSLNFHLSRTPIDNGAQDSNKGRSSSSGGRDGNFRFSNAQTPVSFRPISILERLLFARSLAQTLSTLHLADWVHGNITNRNIISFQDLAGCDSNADSSAPSSTGASATRLGRPYLFGFQFTRLKNDYSDPWGQTRLAPSDNLYRHPERQVTRNRAPERPHTPEHDIYSLGVVFLEIGLGQLAEDLIKMGDCSSSNGGSPGPASSSAVPERSVAASQTAKSVLPTPASDDAVPGRDEPVGSVLDMCD